MSTIGYSDPNKFVDTIRCTKCNNPMRHDGTNLICDFCIGLSRICKAIGCSGFSLRCPGDMDCSILRKMAGVA